MHLGRRRKVVFVKVRHVAMWLLRFLVSVGGVIRLVQSLAEHYICRPIVVGRKSKGYSYLLGLSERPILDAAAYR